MHAPEHYRPYHHAHAQAGAPFCLRNGFQVTILHICPDKLIGMFGRSENAWHAGEWGLDGALIQRHLGDCLDLVMLPLGMLEGKPVFAGDRVQSKLNSVVTEMPPTWSMSDADGWCWPRPTAQFPQTNMTNQEINEVMVTSPEQLITLSVTEAGRRVANAAIAQAIRDEQVFTEDMVQNRIKKTAFKWENGLTVVYGDAHRGAACMVINGQEWVPAHQLEQVAETVRQAFDDHVKSYSYGAANYCIEKVDLAAIIARVKGGAA